MQAELTLLDQEADLIRDHLRMMKLSYLVELFRKLNFLNLQLEGTNTHIQDMTEFVETYTAKYQHIKDLFSTIGNHLAILGKILGSILDQTKT